MLSATTKTFFSLNTIVIFKSGMIQCHVCKTKKHLKKKPNFLILDKLIKNISYFPFLFLVLNIEIFIFVKNAHGIPRCSAHVWQMVLLWRMGL